jgi:hypothetical protein
MLLLFCVYYNCWLTDRTMAKRKRTEGQTMIYITPYRKLNIELRVSHTQSGMISIVPEGLAVPAPPLAPVV